MTVPSRGVLVTSAVLGVAGLSLLVIGTMSVTGGTDHAALETTFTTGGAVDLVEPTPGPPPEEFAVDEAPPGKVTPVGGVEAGELPPPLEVAPTRVRIPSIEVDSSLVDLGLNPDRTVEVPQDFAVAGWYTGRPVPGETGPGVIIGHVDSARDGPAVFFRLRQLEAGDVVTVERSDGSVAEFRVTHTELVDKDEFPTERVYGSTEAPTLRLITCGGEFDRNVRSYEGNVIVYAEYVGTTDAPMPRS